MLALSCSFVEKMSRLRCRSVIDLPVMLTLVSRCGGVIDLPVMLTLVSRCGSVIDLPVMLIHLSNVQYLLHITWRMSLIIQLHNIV